MINKFPKILHFSWSEGLQNDDRMLPDVSIFHNKEIVVSLKIDGENTMLNNVMCHARSPSSGDHESRHWIKSLHSTIKNDIPDGFRIFGENCFAKHSIFYNALETYFYVFSIWDKETILSWDDTKSYAKEIGLLTVPELYRGLWNEEKVKACFTGKKYLGGEQEGYVCRNANSFPVCEYQINSGKNVRANHVQTDEHWMSKPVWPNELRND